MKCNECNKWLQHNVLTRLILFAHDSINHIKHSRCYLPGDIAMEFFSNWAIIDVYRLRRTRRYTRGALEGKPTSDVASLVALASTGTCSASSSGIRGASEFTRRTRWAHRSWTYAFHLLVRTREHALSARHVGQMGSTLLHSKVWCSWMIPSTPDAPAQ